jgi:hypothetical protein
MGTRAARGGKRQLAAISLFFFNILPIIYPLAPVVLTACHSIDGRHTHRIHIIRSRPRTPLSRHASGDRTWVECRGVGIALFNTQLGQGIL